MKISIGVFSFILTLLVCFSFLFNFIIPLNKISENFLYPRTSINLALNYYFQKNYKRAAEIFNYFNKWQPTVETLLFEGYCLQKQEKYLEARKIYEKALEFNPKDKNAHLAFMEISLKIIENSKNLQEKTIEELLSKIPYEDKDAIDKISYKLLKISEKFNSKEKILIYANIFYLSPSYFILKKTINLMVKEKDIPDKSKKVAFFLYYFDIYYGLEKIENKELFKEIGYILKEIYEKKGNI